MYLRGLYGVLCSTCLTHRILRVSGKKRNSDTASRLWAVRSQAREAVEGAYPAEELLAAEASLKEQGGESKECAHLSCTGLSARLARPQTYTNERKIWPLEPYPGALRVTAAMHLHMGC